MKRVITCMGFFTILALGTSCTSAYWTDRGRDFNDCFHVGVGVGLGAKVKLGPVNLGLLAEGDFFGVRGVNPIRATNEHSAWTSLAFFSHSGELFEGGDEHTILSVRKKLYSVESRREPTSKTATFTPDVNDLIPPQYHTGFEVVVGLGPSVRIGFNVGELADFVLGWVTVDLFDDDVGILAFTATDNKG